MNEHRNEIWRSFEIIGVNENYVTKYKIFMLVCLRNTGYQLKV